MSERLRSVQEDHYDQCVRGWQEVEPLWTVRLCPHGRIQRREPGLTRMQHEDHRWMDLSRIEHPILWRRSKRALATNPNPGALASESDVT